MFTTTVVLVCALCASPLEFGILAYLSSFTQLVPFRWLVPFYEVFPFSLFYDFQPLLAALQPSKASSHNWHPSYRAWYISYTALTGCKESASHLGRPSLLTWHLVRRQERWSKYVSNCAFRDLRSAEVLNWFDRCPTWLWNRNTWTTRILQRSTFWCKRCLLYRKALRRIAHRT